MVLLHWAGGLHCGYCLGNLSSAHSVRSARLYTASMSGGQLLASVPGATSTATTATTRSADSDVPARLLRNNLLHDLVENHAEITPG